jgi:membrane AbrB-like protein
VTDEVDPARPRRRVDLVSTLATLLAAAAGGVTLFALGVPGGMLIGAIAAVAALSLLGVPGARDPRAKQLAQIIVGTGIGASLTPQSLALLRALAVPIIASIAALLIVGLFCGIAISRRTGLDLATSLTATAPGGMMEMVLVSDAIGGASGIVAGVHLMRILVVLGSLPLLLTLLA